MSGGPVCVRSLFPFVSVSKSLMRPDDHPTAARISGGSSALSPTLVDPTLPLSYMATLDDRIADSVAAHRGQRDPRRGHRNSRRRGAVGRRRPVTVDLFVRRKRPRPADSGLGGLPARRLLRAGVVFPRPSGEPSGSSGGAEGGVGARRYPTRVYNSPFRQSVISEDERGGAFRSEAPFCFQQTRSPATFRRQADPPLAPLASG